MVERVRLIELSHHALKRVAKAPRVKVAGAPSWVAYLLEEGPQYSRVYVAGLDIEELVANKDIRK